MNDIQKNKSSNDGFTLIEVVIAIVIMSVMMLSTLAVFTYAVQNNRGNNLRSQALTVLQQQAELYRSSKFTSAVRDSRLDGGTHALNDERSADNTSFVVNTTVDNDPFTDGIQTGSESSCKFKEIKIVVTPKVAQSAWETAIVSRLTIQRVRGN